MNRRRGSTLVESSIVFLLFLVLLLGILDFGQILFFHHFLAERVRAGARYAVLHQYDAQVVRNVVVYNSPAAPPEGSGLFGLRPEMVQVVRYDAGTAADRVAVGISGYRMRFLSPWVAGVFTPGPFRAVLPLESAGTAH